MTDFSKSLSILSDRVIRLDCYPNGEAPLSNTFAVRSVERFSVKPLRFTVKRTSFRNPFFQIEIQDDGKPFSDSNLKVQWTSQSEVKVWRPGDLDQGNLGGHRMALDHLRPAVTPEGFYPYDPMKGFDAHCTMFTHLEGECAEFISHKVGAKKDGKKVKGEMKRLLAGEKPKLFKSWPIALKRFRERIRSVPPGLLSTQGVTIFRDDSLPWNEGKNGVSAERDTTRQTLYFIYYDNDYKLGLSLLKELMGKVPSAPDWIFGTWFSCYRQMGEKEYVKLLKDFQKHDLPLDVAVVDTDWHRDLWFGFDWNKKLFPKPKRFAKWLKQNKIVAPFNVHPGALPGTDSRLPEYMEKSGCEENLYTEENTPHEFFLNHQKVDLLDPDQAQAWFDVFHPSVEEGGCGLWWVDGALEDQKKQDATPVLNELYYHHTQKDNAEKAPILSRGCGLGVHRSTMLFTGDTWGCWETLEEEVAETPRASNNLVAYVSHDIGGFYPADPNNKENRPPDDLYLRWVQFGCFSSVMRFHSINGVREPWRFGKKVLSIARRYLWMRACLLPYFRQLAQEAVTTGVGLCRPLYYEFPKEGNAYQYPTQYMLGDGILVAPVVNPSGKVRMWIPPGEWKHGILDRTVIGPAVIEEEVPLEVLSFYTRVGAEIPFYALSEAKKKKERKKMLVWDPASGTLVAQMGL